jgi:hypothetical protein
MYSLSKFASASTIIYKTYSDGFRIKIADDANLTTMALRNTQP